MHIVCKQIEIGVGENGSYNVNISDLLDDVQVWRTITAGFPYRTASQLGCETKKDAFVATKQAVYCIIYGFNPETRYKGGDDRGEKIKNAIINLVNEGKNGTRTPSSANVSVNKVNSLVFDGDYCYQEFSVSSLVNIGSYTVTATNGLPSGSKIVNTSNTEQSTFDGNAHFKVQIPKNKITNNIEATIAVRAKCETFPIFYGNSPSSSLQDYALTFDPMADEQGTAKFNVDAFKSTLKVIKEDSVTKYKIPNVEFNFRYSDGENIGNYTTDKNGEITIKNLRPDTVIAKEIKTGQDYVLDSKEVEIKLSYADSVVKSIGNDKKTGNLKIYKVDKDNHKILLENVEFDLYSKELDKVIGTYYTNKNGEITINNLRVGEYTLIEKKTNKWYNLADNIDIKVEADKTNKVTVENAVKKGKIKVIKVDEDFNEIKLKGVEFKIYNEDNELVDTLVTNENGEAVSKDLRIDKKYTIEETKTLQNYILNEKPQTVTLNENQITDVIFNNEHKKGNLKIYKVDKDNNKIALGNVNFDLYSEEFKKVIGTYTTNVDGEISIDNLRIGNYKLIEKNTGKWYNLADDTEVKIQWNKTTESMVENELQKGQIKVIKIDLDNNEVKLKGVKFDVLDEKGNILETIITNENGEAYTSRYAIRDFEKLIIREKETLNEYVLNDKPETVVLEANQIKTITFENELKKGQIKVIKVDLDNNEVKIPNVEFKVYDENGNVVDTLITDKNGEATSKRLPINHEYKVQEVKTGEWYVLDDKPHTVTLEQDKIKDMTFTNEKKKGQIRIIKVDLDDNKVLLEGVTFDIVDEKGNVVDTIVTDKNGEATTKRLPIDQKYTAVEKQTRKEYVLTKETQTVELKQDEITSITFENEKIKGYVEITKVDSKTKETLEGAEFGIYNEKDEQVGTLKTDETGKATSELLPYGKYYLKELDTGSVYYLLNENTYEFEIVKNGETIPVTIENDGVEIKVNVDKKGTTEIKPGEMVNYEFSNVANTSNIYLDNFKWYDYIPTDYVRLQTMTTGTWNQDLTYSVYYKTNKSDDYILRYENLKTTENHTLDFTTEIELAEDEYIAETMFDFGKVDVGFKEDVKPTMQCKSFDTLQEGETFTNHTKTIGIYYGVTAEANSKWTTIVHIPEEQKETTLPRTGK